MATLKLRDFLEIHLRLKRSACLLRLMGELGRRLTARREALGLSLHEAARATKVPHRRGRVILRTGTLSDNALQMYEEEDIEPGLHVIRALAETLQCTPEWIAFGVGPEPDLTPKSSKEATIHPFPGPTRQE